MFHQGPNPIILVVEDDASLRGLIVYMLNRHGFATVDTGFAAEALSIVRSRKGMFDLALVDVIMPRMSGLDLAGELDREYPDLKILYMSGFTSSVVTDALQRRSPDRLLLKPFNEQALVERVQYLLTARREAASEPRATEPQARSGTLG